MSYIRTYSYICAYKIQNEPPTKYTAGKKIYCEFCQIRRPWEMVWDFHRQFLKIKFERKPTYIHNNQPELILLTNLLLRGTHRSQKNNDINRHTYYSQSTDTDKNKQGKKYIQVKSKKKVQEKQKHGASSCLLQGSHVVSVYFSQK